MRQNAHLSAIFVAMTAGLAIGQTAPVQPRIHTWLWHPASTVPWSPRPTSISPNFLVVCGNQSSDLLAFYCPTSSCPTRPAWIPWNENTWQPGQWVDDATYQADYLMNGIVSSAQAGWIDQYSLSITLGAVGEDPAASFADIGNSNFLATANWPVRTTLYNPCDRLPGLDDHFENSASDAHFPFDGATDRSNRSYRHPFLLTATEASPLRQWMGDFLSHFKANLVNNTSGIPWLSSVVPAFNFDQESSHIITNPYERNHLYILFYLAKYSGNTFVANHDTHEMVTCPDIWNTWKVPGTAGWTPPQDSELHTPSTTHGFASTGGQTLAQLYQAERAVHPAWPADISDTAHGGIDLSTFPVRADNSRNREFMMWWTEVCNRAEQAIWQHSVYSAIHGVQGWSHARCGNYDVMYADGQDDRTSWYKDLGQLNSDVFPVTPPWPSNDSAPWSNQLPRNMFIGGSGVVYRKDSSASRTRRVGLWAVSEAGTTDSPTLYFGNGPYCDGGHDNGSGVYFRGPRQASPFVPERDQYPISAPDLLPTTFPTNDSTTNAKWLNLRLYNYLRNARFDLESSINSPHTSLPGDAQLVTWENHIMPYFWDPLPGIDGVTEFRYWSEREPRQLLELFRSKRLTELFAFDDGYRYPSRIELGWRATEALANRVWAANVAYYDRISGTDSGTHSDSCDMARLEDTLYRSNTYTDSSRAVEDYTVDVFTDAPISETDSRRLVRLEVGVKVPMGCYDDPSQQEHCGVNGVPVDADPARLVDGVANQFEINVECAPNSFDSADQVGVLLEAYNFSDQSWYMVPPADYFPYANAPIDYSYTLLMADGSMRRTYILTDVPGAHQFVTLGPPSSIERGCNDATDYNLRLRVIQATNDVRLSMRADLIQVTPIAPDPITEGTYSDRYPILVQSGGDPNPSLDAQLTGIHLPCDGDINADGIADGYDLDYLINVVAGGDNPAGTDPDFNRDGAVDTTDVVDLAYYLDQNICP